MQKNYYIIVPGMDRTGPTNVAVEIAKEAAESGWNVTFLSLSGQPGRDDHSKFATARKFRLRDLLTARGVIHSHGLRPDLTAWLFTWVPGCKVLTTLHGHFPGHLAYDYPRRTVQIAWCIWSAALARFDHRVCISRTMVRHYARQFPRWHFDLAYNFRSIHAARQPVEVKEHAWFQAQREAGRPILLYAGALSTRKNARRLVEAVVQHPDLAIVLCGQGAEQHDLQVLARTAGRGRILLAGHVSTLDAYLAKADVFVLPSHAEGLPLVVLEAARSGLPCLLSNIAVHRELAALGFGETFDRWTFSDFAEKARRLAVGRTRQSDDERIRLWHLHFAPAIGYLAYERLFVTDPSRA